MAMAMPSTPRALMAKVAGQIRILETQGLDTSVAASDSLENSSEHGQEERRQGDFKSEDRGGLTNGRASATGDGYPVTRLTIGWERCGLGSNLTTVVFRTCCWTGNLEQ